MENKSMLRFCENDIILAQGSTKKEMYKILSGKAAVYFNYGMPEEYLVGIFSEQRCFGEFSILCGKPSPFTVVAISEVLVLCITEHSFDEFIKNNTQNAISIMQNLANTVDILSMHVNMVNDEFSVASAAVDEKTDLPQFKDITKEVRQYAAMDSLQRALFSTLV